MNIDTKTKTLEMNINTGGGGTKEHNKLINRDLQDQHPISSITGLQEALNNAGKVEDVKVNNQSVVSDKIANINLKTINNQSISGTGNIDVDVSDVVKTTANQELTNQQKLNARNNIEALGSTNVKQETGTSTTDVMSQKGVTDLLANKQDNKPDGTHLLISTDTGKLDLVYIPSLQAYVDKTSNEIIGGSKIFETMPSYAETTLPVGYTELEYIESNGTQYIDTGHIPTRNLNVYVEYMPLDSQDMTVFGAIINGSERINFNTAGVNVAYRAFGSTKNTISNVQTVNDISVVSFNLHDGNYDINENTGTIQIGSGYVSSYNLFLFALNAGSGSAAFNSTIRMYRCKIWDSSNVLIRDYIPAKDLNNRVGLYDKQNNVFYISPNNRSFTAGNEVFNLKPLAKFEDIDDEISDRLVTTIDVSSDDTHYPSAKCVYDIVGDIESLLDNINDGNGVL